MAAAFDHDDGVGGRAPDGAGLVVELDSEGRRRCGDPVRRSSSSRRKSVRWPPCAGYPDGHQLAEGCPRGCACSRWLLHLEELGPMYLQHEAIVVVADTLLDERDVVTVREQQRDAGARQIVRHQLGWEARRSPGCRPPHEGRVGSATSCRPSDPASHAEAAAAKVAGTTTRHTRPTHPRPGPWRARGRLSVRPSQRR